MKLNFYVLTFASILWKVNNKIYFLYLKMRMKFISTKNLDYWIFDFKNIKKMFELEPNYCYFFFWSSLICTYKCLFDFLCFFFSFQFLWSYFKMDDVIGLNYKNFQIKNNKIFWYLSNLSQSLNEKDIKNLLKRR